MRIMGAGVIQNGLGLKVDFLDAIMKPEFDRTYPLHDLVATDKSLLDSLIAGAKGGTRTPTPCGTRS